MLTNALLLKISIAVAALLGIASLWYSEWHQNVLQRTQIEQRIVRHHPTREQREEADRINQNQMTGEGLARARKHFLESLGGKK
jgi:hypothetical protein